MAIIRRAVVLAVLSLGLASAASAQSAIAGLVRDTSGAVLPGVTVEAASAVLIEKTRSVTTDATGQYKIVDLRPGTYTVTFTLPGFQTIRREGIEVPTAFTATVSVELKVGAVEETVTVTGASPVVDLQSSVAQTVMDGRVLNTVPTGRDVFAVAQLIAGVTTSTPDVGGSQGMQQPTLQVHGSSTRDMTYQQDGMPINHSFGTGNQTGFYYNEDAISEISYQTSAIPAEVSQGGVRINMIPKEGGNQFKGQVFATGANGDQMQADNGSDELVGLRARNRIGKIYDVNTSLGGPIQRDRVWFFGSFRRWGSDRFVANTFNPDGSQAIDDNRLTDVLGRATVQISKRNKLTASWDQGFKFRGHRRSNFNATFFSPEASFVQHTKNNYIAQAKWTSTVSDRVMVDAGISFLKVFYSLGYQPGTESSLSVFDFTKSVLFNAAAYDFSSNALIRGYTGSLTYVTGVHNFKVGAQLREGPYNDKYRKNGDIMLRLDNGKANSVDFFNTPIDERETLDADLGLYVQDSMTVRRLTINAGARYERVAYSIPEENAPAGTYVPARHFDPIPVVSWNNVVPRLGVVYDLRGNGKTAVKASVSKYMQNEGVSVAQNVNPMFLTNDRHSWNDANLDGIAQPGEIGAGTGFSGAVSTRIDPGIRRPYNWEYAVGIQHELLPQLSVTAGYFGRRIRDLYGSVNVLVLRENYIPVTIANPLTTQPLVVYNQDPLTRGKNDAVQTNQDILDTEYNGFEVQVNKRFTSGALLFGGATFGRNRGRTTGGGNNPNNDINASGAVGFDTPNQVNIAAAYPLPYGVQASGSLRTAPGQPLNRTFTVTTTQVPGLTQVTQSVNLVPRGEFRLPRATLLDFRLAKSFTLAGSKLEGIADVYNVLNSHAITSAVQTVGPALGQVGEIVDGRLLRLGVQWRF
jgi:Carboxypeptidase regulatory-like domain